MATLPDVHVGKRLFVGVAFPVPATNLGIGPAEIRGSAFIEGPLDVGSPIFAPGESNVCISRCTNPDAIPLPVSIVKVFDDHAVRGHRNNRASERARVAPSALERVPRPRPGPSRAKSAFFLRPPLFDSRRTQRSRVRVGRSRAVSLRQRAPVPRSDSLSLRRA